MSCVIGSPPWARFDRRRRGSGHRRFSRNDVETLVKVHELVRDKGYTLAGAKRFLRAELKRPPSQIPLALDDSSAAVALLKEVRSDLAGLIKELKTKIA
jgi:DNA-binding transcriptional MerR regulator